MTAYLRPGDIVHLAVPLNRTLRNAEKAAEVVKQQLAQYRQSYGRFGVQVAEITGHAALTAPVVVAVFRSATELEPPCPE